MQITATQNSVPFRIRFPRFPVAVKLTKEGLTFILLSLAIGAAAVNTGNNVLYLIFSLMLGLIVVSGILSKRMLSGLRPRVEFPDHLFSGIENICYVNVRNRKRWLPSMGIRFEISSPRFRRIEYPFFFVPPEGSVSGFARILFPERGVFEINEMTIQTHFPFSFFIKIQRYNSDQKVHVYPKIYRFPEEALFQFTEGAMLDSPYRGDSQQLLHIREYLPQDSSKRIHWKASARSDKLLVKEYQKEQGRKISIYFDCCPDKTDRNTIPVHENGLSLIASLVFLLVKRGAKGTIIFPDAQFDFGEGLSNLIPLLDHLAETKAEHHSPVVIPPTPDPEMVTIQMCSRDIPPVFTFSSSIRPLFIEDWTPFLIDPVSVEIWKGGH